MSEKRKNALPSRQATCLLILWIVSLCATTRSQDNDPIDDEDDERKFDIVLIISEVSKGNDGVMPQQLIVLEMPAALFFNVLATS